MVELSQSRNASFLGQMSIYSFAYDLLLMDKPEKKVVDILQLRVQGLSSGDIDPI